MAARRIPLPDNLGWATMLVGLAGAIGLLAGVKPVFAIATALGCGFVVLVFTNLAAGLSVFAFLSFLEVLNVGHAVSIGKVAGLLLFIAWLAVVATRPEAKGDFLRVHPMMAMVLGLFIAWVAVSAVWAVAPGAAFTSLSRYALNAILFLIVFTAIRNRSQTMLLIAGLLAGAVGASVYGLLSPPSVYAGRLSGASLDPNELASVLVAGIALSAALVANLRERPGLRLMAFGAGVLCTIGTFLTASRGGLIALAAMLVAAILFSGRWRPHVIVGAVMIALVTVFYFTAVASPSEKQRIQLATQGQSKLKEGRTTTWAIAERIVRANPVAGVGAGNFRSTSRDYLLQPGLIGRSDLVIDTPLVVHNTYLEIAAELGIVGLALFGTIVVFSLGSALRAAKNFAAIGDRGGEALARSLAIALVGALVADFFISQEYNKQLWLLLGLGPAILSISRSARNAQVEVQAE